MLLYKCTLPFPPSVNTAYPNRKVIKKGQRGRVKSKFHESWFKSCPPLKRLQISEPVLVVYKFWLPNDKRKRDISNYIKVPEDFLVTCGVIKDDNYEIVKQIQAEYMGKDKAFPRVTIEIYSNP